uniref:Uncharacterized protein n=1 Tax=Pipistrellus kuhlii TaxID=59472 RepID=A0A7J7XC91_PIPKU|nr:hypothetical protein mPipKuh1_010654 [Pipistrellus kuhlii]
MILRISSWAYWPLVYLFFEECLFKSIAHFRLGCLFFVSLWVDLVCWKSLLNNSPRTLLPDSPCCHLLVTRCIILKHSSSYLGLLLKERKAPKFPSQTLEIVPQVLSQTEVLGLECLFHGFAFLAK